MTKPAIPPYDLLFNPTINALKMLGGSGTIEELESKVADNLGLSDEQLEHMHGAGNDTQTEFGYRLAWARTYLRNFGILENSARGVWALTAKGRQFDNVDPREVVKFVRGLRKKPSAKLVATDDEALEATSTWRDEVFDNLGKMSSAAFERLVQRLLRESGFVQVQVTGRSGDGGIDGREILRLAGLIGFTVIFQAKRWQSSVGSRHIRDFRGAMSGRADKALFITTGTFTKDAAREAARDGALPIDLIDGEQLVDKLKTLSLGVQTKKVEEEQVTVDASWFSSI